MVNTIIAVIGIVAVLILFSPVIAEYSDERIKEGEEEREDANDARTFGNSVVSGDVVCDVYIRLNGELDSDRTKSSFQQITDLFASDELKVYIDGSDITVGHDFCFTAGSGFGSTFSLLAESYSLHKIGLTPNSFTSLSILLPADDFEIEMTGKSKTNGRLLTEGIFGSNPQKLWVEPVKVEGIFFDLLIHKDDLPVRFSVEFFLDDVKNDDYIIEFIAKGKSINNQAQDKPYIYELKALEFQ